MKLKIKIKLLDKECMPEIHGDWVDAKCLNDTIIKSNANATLVSLGIAIELPGGYEAIIVNRSNSARGIKRPNGERVEPFFNPNGIGVIDNSYRGNEDIWHSVVKPLRGDVILKRGDRICQFRIQLSQHATSWQKIKDLFYSGIEFEVVDNLTHPNRGGFGHTGI